MIEGSTPGVIYGKDENNNVLKVCVLMDEIRLTAEIRRRGIVFENTLYEVSLENGLKYLAIPRQLQLNPGV